MSVRDGLGAVARHRMRAYFLPLAAGILLAVSAFLPWVFIGNTALGGVPDPAAIWVLGLGVLAIVFAALSIRTRKNSRHPILLVGLTALAILFLAHRLMERTAIEHAWATSQARAIVDGTEAAATPATSLGVGVYLGIAAALVLVGFGITIVVKRVKKPYADPEDDES